ALLAGAWLPVSTRRLRKSSPGALSASGRTPWCTATAWTAGRVVAARHVITPNTTANTDFVRVDRLITFLRWSDRPECYKKAGRARQMLWPARPAFLKHSGRSDHRRKVMRPPTLTKSVVAVELVVVTCLAATTRPAVRAVAVHQRV